MDCPTDYMSDGCSGGLSKGWKLVFGQLPPFEACCVWHDQEYCLGGNRSDRWNADVDLLKCMWPYNKCIAVIAFCVVRFFGEVNFVWKWKKYTYTIDK